MGGEITGDRRHGRERERRMRRGGRRKRNRVLFIQNRSIFGIEKSGKTSGACKLTVQLHAALRAKLPFEEKKNCHLIDSDKPKIFSDIPRNLDVITK